MDTLIFSIFRGDYNDQKNLERWTNIFDSRHVLSSGKPKEPKKKANVVQKWEILWIVENWVLFCGDQKMMGLGKLSIMTQHHSMGKQVWIQLEHDLRCVGFNIYKHQTQTSINIIIPKQLRHAETTCCFCIALFYGYVFKCVMVFQPHLYVC